MANWPMALGQANALGPYAMSWQICLSHVGLLAYSMAYVALWPLWPMLWPMALGLWPISHVIWAMAHNLLDFLGQGPLGLRPHGQWAYGP